MVRIAMAYISAKMKGGDLCKLSVYNIENNPGKER
jgi:hypothetical protein